MLLLLEFLSLNLYRYPFLVQCKHNTAVRGEIISEEQHYQRGDASTADDDTKYTELRWFDTVNGWVANYGMER